MQWAACPHTNPENIVRESEILELRKKCLEDCDSYYNPAHEEAQDMVKKAGDANISIGTLPPGSGQNKGQEAMFLFLMLLIIIAHENCKRKCRDKYRCA